MKQRGVKIGAAAVGVLVVATGGGITAFTHFDPKIQPNTVIQGIEVGGLTRTEAAYKIRVWWQGQKIKPLNLVWQGHSEKFPSLTPSQLDVTLDDVSSVNALPIQSPVSLAVNFVHQGQTAASNYQVMFKRAGVDPTDAYKKIESAFPKPRAATVSYIPHKGLVKTTEIAKCSLDRDAMFGAVTKAELSGNLQVDLPVKDSGKHISDADLAKITDFVSSFTTHHPTYMYDRNSNIATAARKINGVILMPGEVFSFNNTVGQRTLSSGFHPAPVYENGKHAVGVGGGICQVSTTLYNAVLMGGLQVVERVNHSMPVAYVKLGRDATVDWGEIDFKFRNSNATPIAICTQIDPGSLTFRIFGQAVAGRSIRIDRSAVSYIPRTTQYITNRKLAPGKQVVQDSGRDGMKIKTWRVTTVNGKEVSRQYLGQSYYKMHPRIIERGPAAALPPIIGKS